MAAPAPIFRASPVLLIPRFARGRRLVRPKALYAPVYFPVELLGVELALERGHVAVELAVPQPGKEGVVVLRAQDVERVAPCLAGRFEHPVDRREVRPGGVGLALVLPRVVGVRLDLDDYD